MQQQLTFLSAVQSADKKNRVADTMEKMYLLHQKLNDQLRKYPNERPRISSPQSVHEIMSPLLENLDQEELWVMNLDVRNRVMSLVMVYKGNAVASQVRVAELFHRAVLDKAIAIIVCHNHPSGDSDPSPDDVSVTRAIVDAGKLLDIQVLDHIIVAKNGYCSLKERRLGF